MFCHSARNSLWTSLRTRVLKSPNSQINIFQAIPVIFIITLLLLQLAFLPIVAYVFSQSEDRIGTQLIFPNSTLTSLKPNKFFSCHQPAYYAYYFVPCFPPKEGASRQAYSWDLAVISLWFLFAGCCWLVAGWRRLISFLGKVRFWLNTLCMAFPLQFAISLPSKKCFTSSYLQTFVEKSICSIFPSGTLRDSLKTTGKRQGGILLFWFP